MTRRRVLACTAALLLPGALAAQDTSDTAAPDSTCSAWAHSLREHGASAFGVRLDQRRECVLDDSTVAGLWRTIGTDTTQLLALAYVTVNAGGARPLRTLLQTLTERERPAMVRLAALVALVPYLDPADICAGRLLDTLRAPSTGCWATHPSYHASSSIEPLLRDSIRARLREAASEPGAVGRAAAGLSSEWSLPERWSDERAAWCRRSAAAFGPALRMSAAVLTSDELLELAECTESGPAGHVVNSVLLAPLLAPGRVGDVGSGAGLPGLVLAIARPDAHLVLIEPMERRTDWLTEEAERLGLGNVTVLRGRAEEVAPEPLLDQVTARAVSALSRLVPLCAPLLKPGGELILLKGARVDDELAAASKALRAARVRDPEVLVLGEGIVPEVTRVFRAKVGA